MGRYLSVMVFCFGLTGCSSYSNDFPCKIGRGAPCTSLHEVSEMIDREERLKNTDLEAFVVEENSFYELEGL